MAARRGLRLGPPAALSYLGYLGYGSIGYFLRLFTLLLEALDHATS
jgi:hypothetical protein